MTDKDIIKALECCILGYCQGCFYGETDQRHCKDDLMKNALALINIDEEAIRVKQKQLDIFFEFAGRLERIVEENTEIKPCDVFSQVLKDMEIEFKPNDVMESNGNDR